MKSRRPLSAGARCLCLLWLQGCEPLIVDLGVEQVAFDASEGSTPLEGGAPDGSTLLDGSDAATVPDECWSLVEVGLASLQSQVVVRTLAQLSCQASEAGEPPDSAVYWASDGTPLMTAGQRYSVRWEGTAVQKLQWSGGDTPCATQPVYSAVTDPGPLGVTFLEAPACRAFTAPIDVVFLRVPADDVPIFGNLELCPGECPDL